MPELIPAYERLVELAGGGDLAARMLSLYRPPPYLAACSQGVWSARRPGPGPQLRLRAVAVRGRRSGRRGCAGRRVIGMSDCLWGLLDGDERRRASPSRSRSAGAACSATGSASRSSSATCSRRATTSRGAREALARLPYSLAHNLTARRRRGEVAHRVPLARPRADLPHVPGGHEPSGDRGVARAGARHPHGRARTLHRGAPAGRQTDRRRVRGRLPAVAAVQHGLRERLRDAVHGGLPADRGDRGLPVAVLTWRLGFDAFEETEHTEVLAEGSVA